MSDVQELSLSPAQRTTARAKPLPDMIAIPTEFTYFPSADGTDENLLILLHGLGGAAPLPALPSETN